MPDEQYIVAEISKNWRNGQEVVPSGPLCKLFERVINTNYDRGYFLVSFELHRAMVTSEELNETIIAVFVRQDNS